MGLKVVVMVCAIWLLVVWFNQDREQMEDPIAAQGPPLLTAAEQGDLTTLRALLLDEQDANQYDQCRWSPLMKAAVNGHVESAMALLEAGAWVDWCDKGGYSATMLAASNNHADVLALLLTAGADINRQEHTSGWTALIWAAKQGHLASVKVVLAWGANCDLRDHQGRTALDWARHIRDQKYPMPVAEAEGLGQRQQQEIITLLEACPRA